MMDLMTGMVITSIVVGMVFYTFAGLNKQIVGYTLTRSALTQYALMKTDLNRQFDAPNNQIKALPNGILVENDSTAIQYLISNTDLLRLDGFLIDTLSNNIVDWEIRTVKNLQGVSSNEVLAFNLQILLNQQETTCYFYRSSSHADQINKILIDGI